MITLYFQNPQTLRRFRSGLAGAYIDDFAKHLRDAGYSRETACLYLRTATHVGSWAKRVHLTLAQLTEAALEKFRRHLSTCQCEYRFGVSIAGARLFLAQLRKLGVVTALPNQPDMPSEPRLLQSFRQWMLQHRGVTQTTLDVYERILMTLLDALGDDPAKFTVHSLREFVLERANRFGRHHAKLVVTSVRMLVRYLITQRLCDARLEGAIPTVAEWRLAALPRYLPAYDIERIIAACDASTRNGIRDRAILLLLSRLGLRAGDVAGLRFSDIDWREANLRVVGKGRRESRLPLPQEVGDAILAYLEQARPPLDDDHLFVRVIAPRGPLKRRSISNLVDRAIRRAGVTATSHGAHLLRHSAATEILRQGGSLDVIACILRHRSVETTAHYAKVDVSTLKTIAEPWPEVSSC